MHQPHKIVKHTQKIHRLLADDCLSVFGHLQVTKMFIYNDKLTEICA